MQGTGGQGVAKIQGRSHFTAGFPESIVGSSERIIPCQKQLDSKTVRVNNKYVFFISVFLLK